jgi:hypothetical protein
MIPASYLYKDAYRQHWGRDFPRIAGEEPAQPRMEPHWSQPSVLQSARDLFDLAMGPRRGRR